MTAVSESRSMAVYNFPGFEPGAGKIFISGG